MDNKFSVFIKKYVLIDLTHRSSSESISLQSRRTSNLGKTFIEFAIRYHVIAKNNLIDDKDFNKVFNSLNIYFRDLIYQNFPSTESFLTIRVGKGLTDEELKSKEFILEAFNLYIGNIIISNSFKTVLDDIYLLFPHQINLKNARDSKTILQEFLQSRKIPLPTYLTDNGEKETSSSYKFTTHLNIIDMNVNVIGIGSSKKQSQIDAAYKACEKLNLKQKDSYLILSSKKFDSMSNYKNLNKKQVNSYFFEIFGFDDNYNILPAFIHLRMKSSGIISHRNLCTNNHTKARYLDIIY